MGNNAGGGPQGGYTPQTQGWGGVGGMSTNAQALPPQAQGGGNSMSNFDSWSPEQQANYSNFMSHSGGGGGTDSATVTNTPASSTPWAPSMQATPPPQGVPMQGMPEQAQGMPQNVNNRGMTAPGMGNAPHQQRPNPGYDAGRAQNRAINNNRSDFQNFRNDFRANEGAAAGQPMNQQNRQQMKQQYLAQHLRNQQTAR